MNFFTLKILEKYLLKNYLTTVFYLIFIFIIITVSIDYSEKTDAFSNPQLTQKQIFFYYIAFIPHIINLLLPIFVLIATVLFTSKLANRTEFIPMFSSGINMIRILKPYLIGSIIIALIAWTANLQLIPNLNKKKADFLTQYVDGRPPYTSLSNYSIKIDSNKSLELQYYDVMQKTGSQVSIYSIKNSHITQITRAEKMNWDTIKNCWILTNLAHRKFDGDSEILSLQDVDTLKTFIQPSDFAYDFYLKEKLNYGELKTKILQETIKGSGQINTYKIELYKRDATPFSIIILSLIAGIISSKKIRGGSGMHIAIALLVSSLYIVLDRFSTVFSVNSGLNPMLAAWLPNLIFAFACYYFYKNSQH